MEVGIKPIFQIIKYVANFTNIHSLSHLTPAFGAQVTGDYQPKSCA